MKAEIINTLSQPRKANPPPAPWHAPKRRAGGAHCYISDPLPTQPLLQTWPVRSLELNKEYFQVLRDEEAQTDHMVRRKDAITYQQTSSYAVNLFRSYFFFPNSVKMTVGKYWQLFLER